jgi:hypothetical protein
VTVLPGGSQGHRQSWRVGDREQRRGTEVAGVVRSDDVRRRVLVVSGSTRAASTNTALCRTAVVAAPEGVEVETYLDVSVLPHFDPDDDRDPLPPAVQQLRDTIAAADAVLFCTPEYAGTLPGSFKNLLDWTVGGPSSPTSRWPGSRLPPTVAAAKVRMPLWRPCSVTCRPVVVEAPAVTCPSPGSRSARTVWSPTRSCTPASPPR